MSIFKVCIHLDDKILASVKSMVEKEFTLVDDATTCDAFLTDDYTLRNQGLVNILIVDSSDIGKYKGASGLEGFNHYIIFNELSFLEERVKKALMRHRQLIEKSNTELSTGVNALINLEEHVLGNGTKLPIIKQFQVKSSRDRKVLSDEMEKFFSEIENMMGFKNSILLQYAIEIQEELLMNAIWDANPKHFLKPRSKPIELDENEHVTLEWAFNGKELAISVKDFFGRMEPSLMEKYIDFIFKTGKSPQHKLSEQKIGAGLGMYMVIQRANLLSVFVSEGKVTDVGVVLILKTGRRASTLNSKAIDIIKISTPN